MTLTHGMYICVGKSHTVDSKGQDKFRIKYEDEFGNKWNAVGTESDFEAASIGVAINITQLGAQQTL